MQSGSVDLIINYTAEWKSMLQFYLVCEDDVPRRSEIDASFNSGSANGFKCEECNGLFASNKQLLAHKRVKHGKRNAIVQYICDVSVCPAVIFTVAYG